MKTPQRNFVVEFKSRRQLKPRANSIWGDTDFKALAQEIEGQSADLGYSRETPAETSSISVPSPDQAVVHPVTEMGLVHTDQANTSDTTPQIQSVPGLSVETPAVMQSATETQDDIRVPRPRAILTRAKPVRTVRSPKKSNDQPAARPETPPTSLVEIAALDIENTRLKQLLVEHLRDQNLQLKQMLGRFDVVQQA
jgi:hypothetical protein